MTTEQILDGVVLHRMTSTALFELERESAEEHHGEVIKFDTFDGCWAFAEFFGGSSNEWHVWIAVNT